MVYEECIKDKHDFMFIDLHRKPCHPSMFRRNLSEFVAPPLSSLRMRTLSGGARHFVEKQNLREETSNSALLGIPCRSNHEGCGIPCSGTV